MSHEATVAKWSDVLSEPAIALVTGTHGGNTTLVVKPTDANTAPQRLAALAPVDLFRKPITRPDEAAAAHAALSIRFDDLDPPHAVVQDLHTPTGSLWHAIIHRREGDFWNSKYWYAKARGHGAHATMATAVPDVLEQFDGRDLIPRVLNGGAWAPDRFVDLVEQVHATPDDPRHAALVQLQIAEWQTVFEHTIRAAVK